MSELVRQLTERAFARAAPADANTCIDEVRAQREASTGAASFSYELFVPAVNVDSALLERALPRLVNFLSCRGFSDHRAPGVFLSLFTGDGLFFIDAGEGLEVLARARGLSIAECYRRYGDGGTGDPKALGP